MNLPRLTWGKPRPAFDCCPELSSCRAAISDLESMLARVQERKDNLMSSPLAPDAPQIVKARAMHNLLDLALIEERCITAIQNLFRVERGRLLCSLAITLTSMGKES